jgi:hypothetical protein
MPRAHYSFTIGVEFDNTAAGATDDLPDELKAVAQTTENALRSRLSKGYQGTVRVWVTAAAVEEG